MSIRTCSSKGRGHPQPLHETVEGSHFGISFSPPASAGGAGGGPSSFFACLAVTLALCSSSALAGKKRDHIEFAAAAPIVAPRPVPNGAIYQASNGYAALFEGTRARSVGDPLTILLAERTVASKDVSSNSGRDGNVGLTPPSLGPLSLFSPNEAKASGTQAFKGTGTAGQSNSLSGEISVTVAEVLPNGNLVVRGQKQLTLNRGDEYIQISGIVRPSDVSFDNRVLSTRVADARITYTGRGDLQRQSRPGWLQRFFALASPF